MDDIEWDDIKRSSNEQYNYKWNDIERDENGKRTILNGTI